MVDFNKLVKKKLDKKPVDPVELYETLDRASDKGELRKAQSALLTEWHGSLRDHRDVIVKLHTGQGKTLIGLLILLSRVNETESHPFTSVRTIISWLRPASRLNSSAFHT